MPSILPLCTLTPPSASRLWSSHPHPTLPLIATASSDKTVRLYSLASLDLESTITGGHKRSIRSCAWKPSSGVKSGESVLATGSFDASCGVWRRWEQGTGIGKLAKGLEKGKGTEWEGLGAEGEPEEDERDFTRGLAGGAEEEDEDEDEWRFAVILDGHDSEIKSLAFSPTAPLLATCSRDKSVWIWEELEDDNFETVAVLQEHDGDVKCVAWSPVEELLVSGSYDNAIRVWREDVDDWACCGLLEGHSGTVWWVEFEGADRFGKVGAGASDSLSAEQQILLEQRKAAGPRIISCSDDLTIRIWRRVPKEIKEQPTGQGKMPSIWKNRDFEEEWVQECVLPKAHERAVYAVSWSRKTGRVVSTGSDGKVVVYEERWKGGRNGEGDSAMADASAVSGRVEGRKDEATGSSTEWMVVAEVENAHDVFEVNHVVWAPRADKGKIGEDEEVIVTTGDDGEVKVWLLNDD
ncbi:hypothetical protein B0A48_11242 [Cryoendolithus antarcticus]|uniref:Probable cytosolic iron-sulfur protein assembly protein 1 n=1 Tax=Cryoendolithus antarcticus TaxID=1507870 RepID=A0A1V8SV55_9PEZI|nr:hypothetical protein B0A48_11242 [Cryoendolithus antarcticus]